MARVSLFSAPFLLGFDAMEERLDRLAKAADSYPPYNIERTLDAKGNTHFVISVAVAGFGADELELIAEDNQLLVRGRQKTGTARDFLHHGIAMRQFQRNFLLAEGMQIETAGLRDGLLVVEMVLPKPQKTTRRIEIRTDDKKD